MMFNTGKVRIVLSLVLLVGIIYLPRPVFSQGGDAGIQNLIVNGGFEGGFQEDFGVGYGWGAFSNGNAVVGWNFDDWESVVEDGTYAQRVEIRDALDLNRYAGIYQTVSVIPGEQYKLTIKGLIRSEEGDVNLSDYGYRMQYAVDYDGGIAWELVPQGEWKELPWDEQPLSTESNVDYQYNTYQTTITAKADTLTLFVRGWKKWLNNGSGVFDLDQISIVGPAPEGFQAPVGQAVSATESAEQPAQDVAAADFSPQTTADNGMAADETQPQTEAAPQASAQETTNPADAEAPVQAEQTTETVVTQAPAQANALPQNNAAAENAQLPISGQGYDGSVNYMIVIGAGLLLILVSGAVVTAIRQHNLFE